MNPIINNLEPNEAKVKHYALFDKDVFQVFVNPGEVVEVRIIKAQGKSRSWGNDWAKGTVSGYFDDFQSFLEAVKPADDANHGGIYFTLQVIDPRLIGRAFNRLKPSNLTTSDHNVQAFRWLPIDLDPVRPAGISSSDSELEASMKLREEVAGWIVSNMGFPKPIKAMSGNGAHLLFRLSDMPVNNETQSFIRDTLNGLAERFSNDQVTVDTSVFNPARIWKLYGTKARKGDHVPASRHREERPHRRAYIDDLGGD